MRSIIMWCVSRLADALPSSRSARLAHLDDFTPSKTLSIRLEIRVGRQ
jgi:hypothetical protein